jgi:hypothetical protein
VLSAVSVTLSPASIQLGQTATASAAGLDQNNATMALGTVTWSAGTPGVASITAAGLVTAMSVGQTQIVALAGGKTGQATLTVTPAPASQLAIVAGNNQTATVAAHVTTAPGVIAKDAFNNPVGGVAVTFAVATGGGSVTGGVQTTNANGVATVGSWVMGTASGPNTLTATSAGLSGSPLVFNATALAGTPAAYVVSLSGTAPIAGTAVTVTAQLVDSLGNSAAKAGHLVTWSSTGAAGTFASPTSPADATGKAAVQFTTGTTVGTTSIAVRDTNGLVGTSPILTSIAGPVSVARSSVTPGLTVLAADGVSKTTITVQLRDANGNPVGVSGGTVLITATAGTLTATTDNHDGTYSATLTAPNTPGPATLGATLNGVPFASAALNFVPSTPTQYVVSASASAPIAGTAVTITAQLANVSGGPVQAAGRVVAWQKIGLGGSFAGAQSTTNASGIATVSFTTGVTVGAYQITAIDNLAVSGNLQLASVAGPAARYLLTASSITPVAGASVAVTAQLADANANAVATSGRTVTWSVAGESGGAFTPATSPTASSGAALTSYTTGTSIGTSYTITALDASGFSGSANLSNLAGAPATVNWTPGHVVVTDTSYATAGLFTATNQFGRVIGLPQLTYTSRTATAASVSPAGVVAPVARGQTMIVASALANPVATDSALFAIATPGAPVVRTDLSRFDVRHDTTFTVTVIVDMRSATLLGAATVELSWNPAVLKYVSDAEAGSGVGALVGSANAANGSLVLSAASASGFGGTVQLRNVTFLVNSTTGRTGSLTLLVTELAAAATFTSLLPTTLAISYPLVIR